jgi:uncharacterized protein with HEPN domain
MLTAAMLGIIEKIGLDIMILTEEVSVDEFFASRMTRARTLQLLRSLVQTVSNLPAGTCEQLPQIDWAAWTALQIVLAKPAQHPLQIWVAIRELTPLTVQQLKRYKKVQPQLFSMVL